MKYSIICVLLAYLGLSSAASYAYPSGVKECPVGTVRYSIGCGYVTREATCRYSRPKPDKQQTCGYSACHCISPTVRDEASGQCVHLDKCPGAKIIHVRGGHGVPKIQRRPAPHKTPQVAPVVPAPLAQPFSTGYNNANTGYTNYNAGYNNANTGYANSNGANTGYNNANTGYTNYNSGYSNTNSGYANNAVPLAARL